MIDDTKEVDYFVAERSYETLVLDDETYDDAEEDDDNGT